MKRNKLKKYAVGAVVGSLMQVGEGIGAPIKKRGEELDPYTGEYLHNTGAYRSAQAGSFFAPWKAAFDPDARTGEKIAGALGFGAAFQKRIHARKEKANMNAAFLARNPNTIGESYNPYYMARGGMMNGLQQAELEDGEPFRLPNGEIEGVNGKTHAQGGETFMLPQGTEILGKNMSKEHMQRFKDLGMKLKKSQDQHEKTLKNPHSTEISRRTSAIMMDKINEEYTGLMQEQEMNKVQSGINKFAGGGTTRYTGSLTGENLAYDPYAFSEDQFLLEQQDNLTNGVAMEPWNELPNINSKASLATIPIQQGPMQTKPGFDASKFGNTMGTIGELAPIAYNIGQGLFSKPDKYNYQNYLNPYIAEIRSAMRSRRYNVQPELEANRSAQSTYNYNLRNAGASQAQLLGGLQAGATSRMRGDAASYAQQNNMKNEYLGQQAQMDANLGQSISALKHYGYEANQKNRAAKRNFLSTGLSQLQQYYQMKQLMKNQKANDALKIKSLSDFLSNYGYDENAAEGIYNFKQQ